MVFEIYLFMRNNKMTTMKRMKLKPLLVALSASAILLTSTVSLAKDGDHQHHRGGHASHQKHASGHDLKRMTKFLQLTDQQQQQIKDIFAQVKLNREANKDSHQASKKSFHESMNTILNAETFDEGAFIDLHNQKQAELLEAALTKAKTQHAMLQVLDDEQKLKWQKMKRKAKHKGKH